MRLPPSHFFGRARLACSASGIEVSHRIAEGAPESVLTHTHEDAHFILVTGGDYVTAATGPASPARLGLIYNPPGTTHRDHFERGRGSFFAISVAPDVARAVLADLSTPSEPRQLIDACQYALTIAIARLCQRVEGGMSLEGLCLELLGSAHLKPWGETRAPPPWLRNALELLEDRYTEDLTVAAIARTVGVHPIHLARSFRRHLRCTAGEFARFRRLEKALELLARSALPLADVALSCGFADQSHLSRTFKACLGVSPGEYRASVSLGSTDKRTFRIDKTASAPVRTLAAWANQVRAGARHRR